MFSHYAKFLAMSIYCRTMFARGFLNIVFQVAKRLWVKHVTIRLKLTAMVYFPFRDFLKTAPLLLDCYTDLVQGKFASVHVIKISKIDL